MQYPELVLAGELQNLFEFSHSITPPQLFTNLFSVIRKALPYFAGTRLSDPDSDM